MGVEKIQVGGREKVVREGEFILEEVQCEAARKGGRRGVDWGGRV